MQRILEPSFHVETRHVYEGLIKFPWTRDIIGWRTHEAASEARQTMMGNRVQEPRDCCIVEYRIVKVTVEIVSP